MSKLDYYYFLVNKSAELTAPIATFSEELAKDEKLRNLTKGSAPSADFVKRQRERIANHLKLLQDIDDALLKIETDAGA